MTDGILEDGARVERLVGFRIDPLTEDQLTEDSIWIGSYYALDLIFNGQGKVWGGGDSRCIGDRGGQCNGWRECNCRCDCDGGSDGGCWCLGRGWSGREETVGHRFSKLV